MTNVIDFSSVKKKQSSENVIEFDVADYVEGWIVDIIEDLEDIFGVDVDPQDEVMNDFRMAFLHLTGAICRINNIKHPMHLVADDFIEQCLDEIFSDFSEESVADPDQQNETDEEQNGQDEV